jgi:hypothetical protein
VKETPKERGKTMGAPVKIKKSPCTIKYNTIIGQEERGFRTYTKLHFLLIDNLRVKWFSLNTAILHSRRKKE